MYELYQYMRVSYKAHAAATKTKIVNDNHTQTYYGKYYYDTTITIIISNKNLLHYT
jgi:hypothetical protein